MKKTLLVFVGIILLTFDNQAQTVTDIQGNVYNTLAIGTQLWMKDNLRTGKYNDGTPIFYPGANDFAWQNNTNGAYSWYQNDSATYSVLFGALYNWFAVSPSTNGGKNICPLNWHVPTHDEWTTLERDVCTSSTCATDFPYDMSTGGFRGTNEGGKMKTTGTTLWVSPNLGATNSTGFNGVPSCKRDNNGLYNSIPGNFGFWWTATSYDPTYAFNRALYYNNAGISRAHGFPKAVGFSMRCVCDFSVNVDEFNFENKIQVYPNPAVDRFTVDYNLANNADMQVYNMVGNLVIQNTLIVGKNDIDVSSLSTGIYLIRIITADREFQKKLIIE